MDKFRINEAQAATALAGFHPTKTWGGHISVVSRETHQLFHWRLKELKEELFE